MDSGIDAYLVGAVKPLANETVEDREIRGYLALLNEQLSGRGAAEALGYYPTSTKAYQNLLLDYRTYLDDRSVYYSKAQVAMPTVEISKAHRKHVNVETAVVFGDTHGMEIDPRAFSVLLAVVRDLKPERGFLNGDIVSFDSISRFSKAPEMELMFDAEIHQANTLLDALQKASPSTEWVFIEGNHEVRLREYMRKNAPSFSNLRDPRTGDKMLDVQNLLKLKERGIKYVPQVGRSAYTHYGNIAIGHFDKYSAVPGAVAKWFLEHRNETVIQGHTHKRCQLDRRFPDGREITAVEHGCLCKLDPEYVTDPDWAQGFVIITKRLETDRFHIQAIRIVDHEALVGDVLYSG